MGNCLNNSDKVVDQNEQENPKKEMEEAVKIGSSGRTSQSIEPKMRGEDGEKKRVNFKLGEENRKQKWVVKFENPEENGGNKVNSEPETSQGGSEMEECRRKNGEEGERGRGMVRVRVVMTKKELKKILSGEEFGYSNVEELIAGFKLRGRRVSEDRSRHASGINGNWRPALENIPEERC